MTRTLNFVRVPSKEVIGTLHLSPDGKVAVRGKAVEVWPNFRKRAESDRAAFKDLVDEGWTNGYVAIVPKD